MQSSVQCLPHARTSKLIVKELANEVLVYDLERNRASCLNSTAALIWKYCDGKMTVSGMAQLLASEFNSPVDDQIVWLGLQQLDNIHLLDERLATPKAVRRLSRRALIRRLGVAAILLPAIITLTAPPAKAQGSCFPQGAGCAIDLQCCSFNCNAGVCGPAL